ncbi:ATP-binding protein [Pontiellaceae bacterium B12227]|nr:ATP-binding protein [Pontiellaceae bacterium B12227]
MLIEFKVKNFRSIRDEQTLSLVATKANKELPNNVIDKPLKGLAGLQFLKGAALYGANASGKSNVLLALKYLADLVENSATELKPGDSTGTEPFKLDRNCITEPSEFEVTFEANDVRYLYGVTLTSQRIIEEYLYAYPEGRAQCWCHRLYDEKDEKYEWDKTAGAFKNDLKLQGYTKENVLFLSQGADLNHQQLTKVYMWFKAQLRFVHLSAGERGIHPGATLELLNNDLDHDRVISLLKSADFGIADVKAAEREFDIESAQKGSIPRFLHKEADGKFIETQINLMHHDTDGTPIAMNFDDEESVGTRRFFSLLGPWLDTLKKGYTVFIDEIDTSLHPLLVRELLNLLFCSKNNPHGAQIVFTTHNPVFLDQTLLRRDQIWFTEKDESGATSLYPLSDYKERGKAALGKRYLAGVYGGVPFLPEGLQL